MMCNPDTGEALIMTCLLIRQLLNPGVATTRLTAPAKLARVHLLHTCMLQAFPSNIAGTTKRTAVR
jgi:hypothetical protein